MNSSDDVLCLSSCQYFSAQPHDLQADRRHHSGFHIEDVASCRLTVHVLSNTRAFAGTLITDAPSGSLIMQRLRGQTPDWDATPTFTMWRTLMLTQVCCCFIPWVWGEVWIKLLFIYSLVFDTWLLWLTGYVTQIREQLASRVCQEMPEMDPEFYLNKFNVHVRRETWV